MEFNQNILQRRKNMKSVARKPVSVLLVLSIVTSFFILPAVPARAGVLGSFLNGVRPLAGLAGRVGGAVIGMSIGAAFVPPLGMIAGGVLGWIAGGIITGYGTGSLANLATIGGGVVGAMALGPGAVGMVGGFLLGGFLGRMAMNHLQRADALTGGILFKKAGTASTSGTSLTSKIKSFFGGNGSSVSSPAFTNTPSTGVSGGGAPGVTVSGDRSTQIQASEAKYKAAYDQYLQATQKGDSGTAVDAHKVYLNAYQEFQTLSSGK